MKKVWFITGSSRGLGKCLVTEVLKQGDIAIASARNTDPLEDLLARYPQQMSLVKLDVTDNVQVTAAIRDAIQKFGRIDVLVNNAGSGIIGAAEAFTDEQVQSQLAVNLYAPIAITRAVLPYMRKALSGRILQISSMGGRVGNPGLSIYQAAKFGLSGFSEALAREVRPLGILVTSVEPGGLRTELLGSMATAPDIEGYQETVGVRKALFKNKDIIPNGDPVLVAKALIELTQQPDPPIHLLLGSDALERVKQADIWRNEEMEKWFSLSKSTDAID